MSLTFYSLHLYPSTTPFYVQDIQMLTGLLWARGAIVVMASRENRHSR